MNTQGQSSTRIPVAPLAAYIARLGGLMAFPGMGIEVEVDIEKAPYRRTTVERTPEEWARYERTRNRLNKARERGGEISLYIADEICCDVLRVHPYIVYGEEWFEFGNEAAAEIVELEVVA